MEIVRGLILGPARPSTKYPFDELEVGDAFRVEGKSSRYPYNLAFNRNNLNLKHGRPERYVGVTSGDSKYVKRIA